MLDLLVRGGLVVGPDTTGNWDVGVRDGSIVSLTLTDGAPVEARETIDARGLVVVPGGIEPHAHLAHFISMRTESEMYTLGPEDDTVGMAFGGVTTHIDFCWVHPATDVQTALQRRMERWKGKAWVDYSFHIALGGRLPLKTFE